ncbi:MAG: glycosyltransferase family protein [Planctomycetota bacterium]
MNDREEKPPRARAGDAEGEATARPALRAIFVSWGKVPRTDVLAAHLGIPNYAVRHFYRGYRGTSAPLTALKYILQAAHTFFVCVRRLPRIVFVTNPPIFAAIPVWAYARIFRARYVMDFHSGCFIQEHWRRWFRWQRFFARRAALTLAHNAENARVLEEWGAAYEILPSLPPDLGSPAPPPARERPLCVYICSFKEDEPVEAFFEAAARIPGADFAVTGRAPAGLAEKAPPNVRLAGFLPEEEYRGLVCGADVVVALTLRPGTLLYGAQEAIAAHRPLVVSETETLRAYFGGGAVFAENTPEGLRAGIEEALAREEELTARMAEFHRTFLAEGKARLARVVERLHALSRRGGDARRLQAT